MLKTKKTIVFCLVIAGVIVLALVYSRFNPENFHLFPKCPFKMLTGCECPGCGSQRAVYYLLNGEIYHAIRANALFVFAIPYILLLLISELFKSKSEFALRLYRVLHNSKAIWIVFAIIVVWWIVRNFHLF